MSGPWGHGGESAAPNMPWSSLPAVQHRRLIPQDRDPGRAAAPASCPFGWAGFVTSSGSELTPHAGDYRLLWAFAVSGGAPRVAKLQRGNRSSAVPGEGAKLWLCPPRGCSSRIFSGSSPRLWFLPGRMNCAEKAARVPAVPVQFVHLQSQQEPPCLPPPRERQALGQSHRCRMKESHRRGPGECLI